MDFHQSIGNLSNSPEFRGFLDIFDRLPILMIPFSADGGERNVHG